MAEIKIPFKERFREPMFRGLKTWTSRSKRYGKTGDTFKVFGQEFLIEKVERRTLGDVADHYKEEGCESRQDFVEVWNSIHRRKGFDRWRRVYVHVFRRTSI